MTYKTKLPIDTVIERLNSVIKHKKHPFFDLFPGSYPSYPFKGELSGNSFTIVRNISYCNPFEHIISGEIISKNGNTTVNISMKMHSFPRIFMCFWFGFLAVATLIGFVNTIETISTDYLIISLISSALIILAAFAFILFVYL